MRRQDYRLFKTPIRCPNSQSFGANKCEVSIGDLIWYGDEVSCGRVLAEAVRAGNGEVYDKGTVLWVLQLSTHVTFAFPVHVEVSKITQVRDPKDFKRFVRWFFSSELPGIEVIEAAHNYGSLNLIHIDEVLDEDDTMNKEACDKLYGHGSDR